MWGINKYLWGLGKKAAVWTAAGFTDRFAFRQTGVKSSFAKHVAAKLDECHPWEDHIHEKSLSDIDMAISNKDFGAARLLLAFGSRDEASTHCIRLAELAVDLLAEGKEITFELFHCME